PYNQATCDGKILITTRRALNNGFAARAQKKRVAYCSGWATGTVGFSSDSCDKLIPLSDHLDFFELIDFCERLNPEKIHITHTPNASVVQHYLNNINIASRTLE